MRKLLLALLLVAFCVTLSAQKPFVVLGHAPDDLFTAQKYKERGILDDGTFLWSFDAVVSGAQITYSKDESLFETSFLSGVGGALGYKRFVPDAEGNPVCKWGVSGAVLTNVKLNEVVQTHVEAALLVSVYNMTLGPMYVFGENKFGLLVGANITF